MQHFDVKLTTMEVTMDLTLCLSFHECSLIQRSIFQALSPFLVVVFFHSKYKGAQLLLTLSILLILH